MEELESKKILQEAWESFKKENPKLGEKELQFLFLEYMKSISKMKN